MLKDELVLQSKGREVFSREVGFAFVALVISSVAAVIVLFARVGGLATETEIEGFFGYVQSLGVGVLDDLLSSSLLLFLILL